MIERFLEHRDERIRAYAATVIAHDAAIRNEYARARLEDDLALEAMMTLEAMATLEEAPACSIYETDASNDDIPF